MRMNPLKLEAKKLFKEGFTAKQLVEKLGMSATWVRNAIADEVKVEAKCKCICPTCQKEHIVIMYWSGGNYKPRVRCDLCKKNVKTINDPGTVFWK
jgi:transposase-like protein